MTLYLANAFSLSMLPDEPVVFLRVTQFITPLADEMAAKYLSLPFTSAVGHESTAQMITALTNVQVPVSRQAIKLQHGDLLLVFQILQRLPEGKVLTLEELRQVPHTWYLVHVEE